MGSPYEIKIETDRLEWSMEQYQRNRHPLTWRIIEEKKIADA